MRRTSKANADTAKRFNKIANEWYSGDWRKASREMGKVAGQTAGDIALAEIAFAKALAIVAAAGQGLAKAVDAAALAEVREGASGGRGRSPTVASRSERAMGFLGSKVRPRASSSSSRSCRKLYGMSSARPST